MCVCGGVATHPHLWGLHHVQRALLALHEPAAAALRLGGEVASGAAAAAQRLSKHDLRAQHAVRRIQPQVSKYATLEGKVRVLACCRERMCVHAA